MTNELQLFTNEKFGELTVLIIDWEPWFLLSEVCKILTIGTAANVKARLRETEVKTIDFSTIDSFNRRKLGTNSFRTVINEAGLYRVIMRSDKPQAGPFQDWVCGEVLPTIRKTGGYGIQQQKQPQTALDWAREFIKAEEARQEAEKRALEAEKRSEADMRRAMTSMGKLSGTVNALNKVTSERDALLVQTGYNGEYLQARAIPWIKKYFANPNYNQIGRTLTAISKRLGFEIKKIPSVRFGTVSAYHVNAIKQLKIELDKEIQQNEIDF